ncbi:MAG: hypothetical protein HXX16_09465 [Bacteroidales bacterium]|nr:hypothetical protein [Bacteroidales bacterium]
MNRRIFNFLVICVTILLVNLLTTFITDYFMAYKNHTNYLKFTAIGMGAIVLVLYPAFEYINRLVEKFTTSFLKKGKNIFGRTLGVYIAFCIIIFILYCIYARIWFHINVIEIIFKRIAG